MQYGCITSLPPELEEYCFRLLHAQQWKKVVKQIDNIVDKSAFFVSKGETDEEYFFPSWLYNSGRRWTRYYCHPNHDYTSVQEDWGYRDHDVIATNAYPSNYTFKHATYCSAYFYDRSRPVSSSVGEKEGGWRSFCDSVDNIDDWVCITDDKSLASE